MNIQQARRMGACVCAEEKKWKNYSEKNYVY